MTTTPDSISYPPREYGVLGVDAGTLFTDPPQDWLSDEAGLSWIRITSTFYVVNQAGQVCFAAASRASDVPSDLGTSQISIPFVGIAVMDREGSGPPYWTSYGGYLEARMEPVSANIGTVIGLEIDAINFGSVTDQSTPWRRQTLGGATALWLASGGDPANHHRAINPAQLALGIVNNGETFTAGVVFANDAIEGTDGSTGFGNAVAMSTRHLLAWWGPGSGNGERVNYITSTATVEGPSLQFQDGGTLHISKTGNIDFAVGNVASAVNGVGVKPSITGVAAELETFGSDAAVDLKINPKSTGNVQLWASTLFWYSDSGSQIGYVKTSVSAGANMNGLEFADGGPFFYGNGGVIASFGQVASPVSHLSLTNAAAGNPLPITAEGAGDIDILLDPAGTNGTLRLAVPTASSATAGGGSALPALPAAYLIVKDGAGTTRKIPAYNT